VGRLNSKKFQHLTQKIMNIYARQSFQQSRVVNRSRLQAVYRRLLYHWPPAIIYRLFKSRPEKQTALKLDLEKLLTLVCLISTVFVSFCPRACRITHVGRHFPSQSMISSGQ
jgi:hypothetical protein